MNHSMVASGRERESRFQGEEEQLGVEIKMEIAGIEYTFETFVK